jgi:hypothetical protein
VNYAKLLEMNSFFTLHSFLEVGKTRDLPSKFWQTLGDALTALVHASTSFPEGETVSLFFTLSSLITVPHQQNINE